MLSDKQKVEQALHEMRLQHELHESKMFTYVEGLTEVIKALCNRVVALEEKNKEQKEEEKVEEKEEEKESVSIDDVILYSNWCKPLMDKIEQIAKERYPNMPYWIDTGTRFACCMEMLETFNRDLQKASWSNRIRKSLGLE